MLAVGILAWWDLTRIEHETKQVQSDALPGLYTSTQLMIAWDDHYALSEAHVFEDARAILEDVDARLRADTAELEKLDRQYEASIFRDADRQNFHAYQATTDGYRLAQQEALKHGGVAG